VTDHEREEAPITLKVDWTDVAAAPVQHVNHVMGQVGPSTAGVPDGIYLTLTSISPPPITSPADQAAFVEMLQATGLRAAPGGRFHMSREVAQEVINVLRVSIEQYDAAIQVLRQKEAAEGAAS
jgi:hypothetical protein